MAGVRRVWVAQISRTAGLGGRRSPAPKGAVRLTPPLGARLLPVVPLSQSANDGEQLLATRSQPIERALDRRLDLLPVRTCRNVG